MNAPAVLSVSGLDLGRGAMNFELQAGDVLVVLGENSTGKSLLMAHLSGHLRVAPGVVRVVGRDLRDARDDLGVMFQNPGLVRTIPVFENVALPFLARRLEVDESLREKVRLRLGLVGCAHLESAAVHQLSQGDRYCVALARALAGHPRLLLADEPSAALDPAKKALVEELLASLVATGVIAAIVLVTHDLEQARRLATHFLILHDDTFTFGSRATVRADALPASFAGLAA